jgi:dTDP-glucose pyrophosphorylase
MINVVIPMAGAGSRFAAIGYSRPKPFVDVAGRTMIERVLDGLRLDDAHYTLIIQAEFRRTCGQDLDRLSRALSCAFVDVERLTQGAACTALAAREIVENGLPVVFADSDNLFDNGAFRAFIADAAARRLDGSLLTFRSADPKFSFARVAPDGLVTETREKEAISDHAIAGAYYFARGRDFVDCAIDMTIYGDRAKNEFYMSAVYNRAIRRGLKIGAFDIAPGQWHCLGTPELLEEYLNG